jgi:hypothetical protein
MPIVVAILTTTVLGIPIALAIDRNARGPTLVGLGYLYGTAVIYFVELALALLGVHWTLLNVNALAIIIAAACFVVMRKTQSSVLSPQSFSIVDIATLIMVAAYTSFATIARAWEWDFWAIWGLKARTFYEFGSIDWRFLQSRWNDFLHPDYPLLLPLNFVYASLTAGAWNDRWMGLITVAFGVALLLIVRGLAASETTPLIASAITFASTIFALSRFIGLPEAPLIAFAGAGLLFLRRAILFDDHAAMRHGALLIGLAAAAKDEGTALLVTIVIAVALTKWRLLLRLWPAFAVALPWIIIRTLHRFHAVFTRGAFTSRVIQRLSDPLAITALLLRYLTDRRMWVAMLVALLIVPAAIRARERFVIIAFGLQMLVYIAIYCGTPFDLEWHVSTSWSRLTQQLATPLLYAVMVMLARTYDSAHAEARSEQQ